MKWQNSPKGQVKTFVKESLACRKNFFIALIEIVLFSQVPLKCEFLSAVSTYAAYEKHMSMLKTFNTPKALTPKA